MVLIPYIVAYCAIGTFIVAVIVRFFMWAKMPLHLRWELYPIPHEAKRAHYGGSYLEETDWWKKPRETSLWAELKVMIPEIFFLVALKENNHKLWIRSFPFHFGLYLVIGCTMLMLLTGILETVNSSFVSGGLGEVLHIAIIACGIFGLVLGLLGALGLLQRRLTDPALKDYTTSADIFNLLFFIVAFGFTLVIVFIADLNFSNTIAFTHNLVSFQLSALPDTSAANLLTAITVILLGLLTAYIPMTHMSHFVGKYFAYHSIRWNDKPNVSDKIQEKEIQKHLSYKLSWAASHIQGDNKKTWIDVATEEQKK